MRHNKGQRDTTEAISKRKCDVSRLYATVAKNIAMSFRIVGSRIVMSRCHFEISHCHKRQCGMTFDNLRCTVRAIAFFSVISKREDTMTKTQVDNYPTHSGVGVGFMPLFRYRISIRLFVPPHLFCIHFQVLL